MKIKKIINFIINITLPIFFIGSVSYLFVAVYQNYFFDNSTELERAPVNKNSLRYILSDNDLPAIAASNYIKQRTLSLNFRVNQNTSVYGTGWIMGIADSTSNFSYYIATNIHVINEIIKLNGNDINNDNPTNPNSFNIEDKKNLKIKVMHDQETQIIQGDFKESFNGSLEYLAINHNENVPENVNSKTGSNYNGYIDLAILKLDFNSFINHNQNQIFKKWLEFYNKNPTEYFFKEGHNEINIEQFFTENISCGGFPLNKKNGEIDFISKTYNYNSLKKNKYKENEYKPSFAIQIPSKEKEWQYLNIPSKDTKYYSTAKNLKLSGISLGGGSSGSMAIIEKDNKFSVLGIYWGIYASFNGNNDEGVLTKVEYSGISLLSSINFFPNNKYSK